MSILKHAGSRDTAPVESAGGGEPANYFYFQISAKSRRKKYKIDPISTTKNRTKKFIYAKNESGKFLISLANLATFEKNWIFGPKRLILNTHVAQTQYDRIWNCTPIFISSTLRILYVNIATSEWGGGLQQPSADLPQRLGISSLPLPGKVSGHNYRNYDDSIIAISIYLNIYISLRYIYTYMYLFRCTRSIFRIYI